MAVKIDSSEEVIETESRIAKANEDPIQDPVDSLTAHLEGERLVLASESQNAKHGLRYFLLAHHLEPANPLYAADLALSLYECGRREEARRVALCVVQENDYYSDHDFSALDVDRMGVAIAMVLKDAIQALPFFAKACVMDPSNSELQLSYAIALNCCGYEEEACVIGEKVAFAVEGTECLTPDQASQLARVAQILSESDLLRANQLIQKALDVAPDDPEVLRLAGANSIDNQDYQEAVSHFRKATEFAPENERAWGGLQFALFSQGLFEDAFQVGQEILEQWPDYSDVRFNMASAALNMGWHDEAERVFLNFLGGEPNDAFAHAALGLCYAHRKKDSDARMQQRIALDLAGDDPEVQRVCEEIDRILDSGGMSPEQMEVLFLTMLGAMMGRSRWSW